MKKFVLLSVTVCFLAALTAGSALATPIFTGDPFANFGTGTSGLPTNPVGPGYYIWANNEERTSWSVRWTGKDWTTGDYETYKWWGEVSFNNPEGLYDPVKVLWEGNDSGDLILNDATGFGEDSITFTEYEKAGPGWDGFDFELSGAEYATYLTFRLNSDYLTMDVDGVYIGQDLVSILDYCDNSDGFKGQGTRQFEIQAPVPEPGTVLLLGAGLLGLIGLGRKRIKK